MVADETLALPSLVRLSVISCVCFNGGYELAATMFHLFPLRSEHTHHKLLSDVHFVVLLYSWYTARVKFELLYVLELHKGLLNEQAFLC